MHFLKEITDMPIPCTYRVKPAYMCRPNAAPLPKATEVFEPCPLEQIHSFHTQAKSPISSNACLISVTQTTQHR